MNPLHQIPNEIASMIKGYARTEYEPFVIRVERVSYTFESYAECEFITVVRMHYDGPDQCRVMRNRIRRADFAKTVRFIVKDNLGDGADFEMESGMFEKIMFTSEMDDEDILREVMEFAEEYFEVAIKE